MQLACSAINRFEVCWQEVAQEPSCQEERQEERSQEPCKEKLSLNDKNDILIE